MPKTAPDAAVLAADFEHFWSIFPNKTAKHYARQCYARARKVADHASIYKGLETWLLVWAHRGTCKPYLPHASTWLNQRRWEDEHSPEELTPKPPTAPKPKKGDNTQLMDDIRRQMNAAE